MDRENVKENMSNQDIWARALQMLVLLIAMWLVEIVIIAIVLLQLITKIISGHIMENLERLSRDLSYYTKNTCLFLTFVKEEPTFPFRDWDESVK
ncbi:MAG: DUF4389 domain-containing protein [Pseudobacteriovorax sp.]|nr:DUF4389 domain-containing protein [Pseudobacteriovorax sp.]